MEQGACRTRHDTCLRDDLIETWRLAVGLSEGHTYKRAINDVTTAEVEMGSAGELEGWRNELQHHPTLISLLATRRERGVDAFRRIISGGWPYIDKLDSGWIVHLLFITIFLIPKENNR